MELKFTAESVRKTSNKILSKRKLSVEDKINLFEEFINKTNEKIIGTTVYKGYPIGRMLINMRYDIKKNRDDYTEKQLERLEKLGLLEKRVETIEEKVNRVIEFCKENSKIWEIYSNILKRWEESEVQYLCDKEDYSYVELHMREYLEDNCRELLLLAEKERDVKFPIKAVVDKLKKVVNDYVYIRTRKGEGKLEEKYIVKLKDSRVGGVFGYKSEIENIAEKYIVDINVLNQILTEFNSIENFKKIYIDFIINYKEYTSMWSNNTFLGNRKDEEKIIQVFGGLENYKKFISIFEKLNKEGYIITFFDLNEPDFVAIEEIRKLAYLVSDDEIIGNFFENDTLKSIMAAFSKNEFKILTETITAEKKKTLRAYAEELNISKTRVREIREHTLKKLRKSSYEIWVCKLSKESKAAFIEKYFEKNSIFVLKEPIELGENSKRYLIKLLEKEYFSQKEVEEQNEQRREDVKRWYIEEVGFSKKTKNILRKSGCVTVGDIITKFNAIEDLQDLTNCGGVTIAEIVGKMDILGLNFENDNSSQNTNKRLKSLIRILKKSYQDLEKQIEKCRIIREKIETKLAELEAVEASNESKESLINRYNNILKFEEKYLVRQEEIRRIKTKLEI